MYNLFWNQLPPLPSSTLDTLGDSMPQFTLSRPGVTLFLRIFDSSEEAPMTSKEFQSVATRPNASVAVHKPKHSALPRFSRLSLSSLSQNGVNLWVLLLAVILIVNTQGCASVPKRKPVPQPQSQIAQIPGIPYARMWGDQLPPDFDKRLADYKAQMRANNPEALGRAHNYLAISGGGANGAFGAGLLVGWTEAGDRPSFDIVTGISTGALIAPFAFLGPPYDMHLKDVYTTVSTEELIRVRGFLKIITGDAVTSTKPMKELIARYYDQKMLAAIAAEYEKGRRLFVGTTNLDAERPVFWHITAIAASGDSKARYHPGRAVVHQPCPQSGRGRNWGFRFVGTTCTLRARASHMLRYRCFILYPLYIYRNAFAHLSGLSAIFLLQEIH